MPLLSCSGLAWLIAALHASALPSIRCRRCRRRMAHCHASTIWRFVTHRCGSRCCFCCRRYLHGSRTAAEPTQLCSAHSHRTNRARGGNCLAPSNVQHHSLVDERQPPAAIRPSSYEYVDCHPQPWTFFTASQLLVIFACFTGTILRTCL